MIKEGKRSPGIREKLKNPVLWEKKTRVATAVDLDNPSTWSNLAPTPFVSTKGLGEDLVDLVTMAKEDGESRHIVLKASNPWAIVAFIHLCTSASRALYLVNTECCLDSESVLSLHFLPSVNLESWVQALSPPGPSQMHTLTSSSLSFLLLDLFCWPFLLSSFIQSSFMVAYILLETNGVGELYFKLLMCLYFSLFHLFQAMGLEMIIFCYFYSSFVLLTLPTYLFPSFCCPVCHIF